MATTSTNLSLTLPVIADTTNIVDDFNGNMNILDGRFSATYLAVQDKSSVTITGGSITGITDLVVSDGGTGVSTLTDGGVLLGSGTGAITAMAVLADSEMIVGNGTTDPVAESGATLRTSIGAASRALDNISSCAINAALLLGTSDAYALGSTSKMWSDLFLASGAVINFNNGDVTFTHSSNTLTLDGGIFVVSRASETIATNAAWFTLGSTVATGDLTGLRTVITSNATSGGSSATGANVRGVYGQAICTASKHAGLLQGGLFTAGAAAGTVYNVHVLCGHYSSGGATTIGGDLYVGYLRAQTRESGRSVTGNDCLLALENEAVSGTGQIMDSAIRIFDTNMGVDGFTYGIDMSSADITTADIVLQNSETISNATDGIVAISGTLTATSPEFATRVTTPEVKAASSAGLKLYEDGGSGIFIEDGGNVGFNVANPGAIIHIQKTATDGAVPLELIRLEIADNDNSNLSRGQGAAIDFWVAEDGHISQLGARIAGVREYDTDVSAVTALTFWTALDDAAPTEKVRITSNGLFGIGTSYPSGNFDINVATGADAHILLSENDATKWDIYNDHNDDALQIKAGATLVAELDTSGNLDIKSGAVYKIGGTQIDIADLGTSTSAELAGVITGETGSGALVFGTAPSISTINLTSGQIAFPATQNASADANTLDDYEEGTHEVSATMSTSGTVTLNASYDTFFYTKIGRLVTVTGEIMIDSVSSPVGELRLSLPFTSANVTGNMAAVSVGSYSVDYNTGTYCFGLVGPNTTYIKIKTGGDTLTYGDVIPAASDEYFVNVSYFTS